MATLSELLRGRTNLPDHDVEWLHLLVGDWQLVADLSFADLVLWVRSISDRVGGRGPRAPDDGTARLRRGPGGPRRRPRRTHDLLDEAAAEQRILRVRQVVVPHEHGADQSVREEYIPVVRGGHVVAVLTRHTNLWTTRTPSRLELTYLATADALCRMVTGGEFPHSGAPTGLRRGAPRVGDGVIRLDVDGIVTYASPNAVSALHRLGHLGEVVGASLAQIVTDNIRESYPVDEGLPLVVTGRQPWRTEVVAGGTTVSMRAIPLTEAGQRFGAIVLHARRRRAASAGARAHDQGRDDPRDPPPRQEQPPVRGRPAAAAVAPAPRGRGQVALAEAERRVGTIAMVHDQLSQGFDETVEFDTIAQRGLNAVVEVSANGAPVQTVTEGSFGRLRAEDATSLAMIMSELVQNAIEHGLGDAGGEVRISSTGGRRAGPAMVASSVEDDGKGIDPARRPGLGPRDPDRPVPRGRPPGPHLVGARRAARHQARFTASLRPIA